MVRFPGELRPMALHGGGADAHLPVKANLIANELYPWNLASILPSSPSKWSVGFSAPKIRRVMSHVLRGVIGQLQRGQTIQVLRIRQFAVVSSLSDQDHVVDIPEIVKR